MARLLTVLGTLLVLGWASWGGAIWPAGSALAQQKPAEPKPTSQECLACHGDKDLKRDAPKPGRRDSLFADEVVLKASAHARLECVACHRGVTAPHEGLLPAVRCESCHRKPPGEIKASVHARLDRPAGSAACVACHGGHGVQKVAAAGPSVCAACHEVEARQMASGVHAQAAGSDQKRLPTCITCHGGHGVRSRQDPVSPVHRARIQETCATCHGDGNVAAAEGISRPHASAVFEKSVHGLALRERGNLKAATCSDCHRAHDIRRGADPASSVFRGRVAETCGHCHKGEALAFTSSVHGVAVARGEFAAPTCTSCHGEHAIVGTREPGSRVAPLAVSTTCAGCHEAALVVNEFSLPARRGTTFFGSFHGLAVRGGSKVVANCASCHGTHDILPQSDPRSMISPANLARTCAHCHPGAGPQLASARIHVAPGFGEHWLVALVRKIYVGLIVVTIGAMLVHNGLDYFARLREIRRDQLRGVAVAEAHVPPAAAGRTFERFTANERVQHGVLLVTFTILVLTGFALKFPESWWAQPLVWLESGFAVRGWVHRAAGALMCLAGAYHLVYLLATSRGRAQLRALRPRLGDAADAIRLAAFNMGLRASRPRFDRFSYGEKLEYWAVVWGTIVMAATGFLMWFQTRVLADAPLWTIDLATVIHYYEAWLATLAILVWHLYGVVFRAGVYPMSWVWLSGRLTAPQMAEEHPVELEALLREEAPAADPVAGLRPPASPE